MVLKKVKVKNSLLILLLLILSCDSQHPLIQEIIEHAQIETVVDLKNIVRFDWDSAYIIYPFASSNRIYQLTGIADIKPLDAQRGIYFIYQGNVVYEIIEPYDPEKEFLLEIDTNNGFLKITPENSKFRVLRNTPNVLIIRSDLLVQPENSSKAGKP